MAFGLEDLHTPKNVQELERVVLLDSVSPTGSHTLSGGVTFSELDSIVIHVIPSTSTTSRQTGVVYTKESLVIGNVLASRVVAVDQSAIRAVDVQITTDTTVTLSNVGTNTGALTTVIGYRRKFSTTPISKTIDLGTIGLSENITLYEADLGSEFFNADGTIKESVRAAVWLNDGTIWFEAGSVVYNATSADRYGARASKFNVGTTGGIRIRTGNRAGNGLNNSALLTASALDFDSAPARLVLSMGERYAPTLAP